MDTIQPNDGNQQLLEILVASILFGSLWWMAAWRNSTHLDQINGIILHGESDDLYSQISLIKSTNKGMLKAFELINKRIKIKSNSKIGVQ